ncbi:MAG: MerR family transcriptional regulator [Oscillospiraceae bacterium]|nr:MerR family transcriptional regulator [Oscillospiraceae bacterium]
MNETRHISEVCRKLGTTSRTIRYYEQLSLLRTVRESRSAPRRLDAENIEKLRKILFLRKIGLSLEEITEIVRDGTDAAELLRTKANVIYAEITVLRQRIRLLEKVTKAAENGDDIYSVELAQDFSAEDAVRARLAMKCIQCMLERRFADMLPLLDARIRHIFTPETVSMAWERFCRDSGAFRETGKQSAEGNVITTLLHFEKISGVVKIAFEEERIAGIILEYWNGKEQPYV